MTMRYCPTSRRQTAKQVGRNIIHLTTVDNHRSIHGPERLSVAFKRVVHALRGEGAANNGIKELENQKKLK